MSNIANNLLNYARTGMDQVNPQNWSANTKKNVLNTVRVLALASVALVVISQIPGASAQDPALLRNIQEGGGAIDYAKRSVLGNGFVDGVDEFEKAYEKTNAASAVALGALQALKSSLADNCFRSCEGFECIFCYFY